LGNFTSHSFLDDQWQDHASSRRAFCESISPLRIEVIRTAAQTHGGILIYENQY